MNTGLFAPIQQPQQQMGMPAQMPQGMPAQMPQQQQQQQQMPIQMPQEGWTPPNHSINPEGSVQSMGIMGQNEAGKYSVGDPTLDRYINLFLA